MSKNRLDKILTKEILENSYNECKSLQKVAEKLQVSFDSVSKYMKIYNIPYSKTFKRKYHCNDDFFKVESPESFYLAGFIAADGSLQSRKYSKILKICLSLKDKDHLIKLNNLLDSNYLIKEYITFSKKRNKYYFAAEVQITSKEIFNDLAKFNITTNKTFVYSMPNWLMHHKFLHHFMRGYFDGDGSITYCSLVNGRKIKQLSFNIIGTYSFIDEYRNILVKNCALNHTKIIKYKNIYKIYYSGNRIIKRIYNFLYKNATVFLNRKQSRFT